MFMAPVQSSNIRAIGYDPEKLTLRVSFLSGSAYDYVGVTPDVHGQLMAAPSVGRFFAQEIKGRYECEQAG